MSYYTIRQIFDGFQSAGYSFDGVTLLDMHTRKWDILSFNRATEIVMLQEIGINNYAQTHLNNTAKMWHHWLGKLSGASIQQGTLPVLQHNGSSAQHGVASMTGINWWAPSLTPDDSTPTESTEKPTCNEHSWVDLGTRRTWCKVCDQDGEWDFSTGTVTLIHKERK